MPADCSPSTSKTDRPRSATLLLLWACLLLATAAAYHPVHHHTSIAYDDADYLTANPHVQQGLTFASIRWALTDPGPFYWQPVAYLSHMLDVTLFGSHLGWHHTVSLAWHLLNVLLLGSLLQRLTYRPSLALIIAAGFALHPLNVEAVAWLAERKTLLATAFALLTLHSHVSAVRATHRASYAAWSGITLACYALSLASKPTAVLLPLVLLLLDVWPLRRTEPLRFRVIEKLPLLALALTSGIVTWISQHAVGATHSSADLPLAAAAANAVVSHVRYLTAFFLPHDLAMFYPHPSLEGGTGWSLVQVLAAAVLLMTISLAVARLRRPPLIVGWLWFLLMLLPVVGFIQVGRQAMADRHMMLPMVGLLLLIAWLGCALARSPHRRRIAVAAVVAVCLALALLTHQQVRLWRDSVVLFEHTLQVAGPSSLIETNLARVLLERGHLDAADARFRAVLDRDPRWAPAWNNRGHLLLQQGDHAAAVDHFTAAVRLSPADAVYRFNLAVALHQQGDLDAAVLHYTLALEAQPTFHEARRNRIAAYLELGQHETAAAEVEQLLIAQPHDTELQQLRRQLRGE